MTQDQDFEAAVDQLHKVLMERYPDPVDVYEDELAKKLGFSRQPGMPLEEWREERVRVIDRADGADGE